MNRTWAHIEPFLKQVEQRYRNERLRHGPAAAELTGELEAAVTDVLRDACEVYAHSGTEQRELIRTLFRWSYVLPRRVEQVAGQYARAFEETGSEDLLRKAAMALTLAGGRPDLRDSLLAFKYLRDAAARKGIDAERVFMLFVELVPPGATPKSGTKWHDDSFATSLRSYLRRSE